MKKRLFLTGDQGCGKSTLIQAALGDKLTSAGGFLTVRTLDGVILTTPRQAGDPIRFLDFSGGDPVYAPELFLAGVRTCLAQPAPFAVLDEIGGVELLSPEFHRILRDFFASGTPCIGVVKNPSSAEKLRRRLGLSGTYLQAAADLRQLLEHDVNTLLIQADDGAAALVRQWVQEYVHA